MYTEEPKRRINFKNILKKGLIFILIIVAIILVIWLFTKINSAIHNKTNVDVKYSDDGNKGGTLTNPDLYSNEFITGYTYFHDTAKDYFLVHELPSNGLTIKYTLKELIDKELILPFSYKNNETCDLEASYVNVTNQNNKYTMTTTLVCGKEVAKTTEELACNQLCSDGNCKPTPNDGDIEYQYKQSYKATETIYSCPSGYTKSGATCIKNTNSIVKATKKVTYTCPDGYDKSGTKCIKPANKIINATKKVTYECEAGYTKNGNGANTTCIKNINAEKIIKYECPTGYTPTGSGANMKCTKIVPVNVDPQYNCSDSTYTKSGSGSKTICTKKSTYTTPKEIVSYTSTCSTGKLIENNKCRVNTPAYYVEYTTSKGKSINGCKLVGTSSSDNCYGYKCSSSIWTYYCPASTKDIDAVKVPVYGCNTGVPSGNSCIQTTKVTEFAKPSCKEGKLNSDKTKCIVNKEETVKPISKTNYSCSNGKLNGTKCTINDNTKVIKKTSYSCPTGYNKDASGKKCTSNGQTSTNFIKNIEYICNKGYTSNGTGENTVCTKGSVTRINATKSTKTVTKYRYKWSTETVLEGWEKTGLTRQIITSSK